MWCTKFAEGKGRDNTGVVRRRQYRETARVARRSAGENQDRFSRNAVLTWQLVDACPLPRGTSIQRNRCPQSPAQRVYIVKFREFDSIDEVEKLRGAEIRIPKDALHELGEHEYYFHEIIGCDVFTTDGAHVGTVKEILQPGANDVWVVKRQGSQKDLYLPYIADVVKQVFPEQKRIVIEWMEGLE